MRFQLELEILLLERNVYRDRDWGGDIRNEEPFESTVFAPTKNKPFHDEYYLSYLFRLARENNKPSNIFVKCMLYEIKTTIIGKINFI